MPNDEKQEQEPGQIVQQTADALFDGILAFGEGMLRLGEIIERLGESLAKKLLAHKCTEDCSGKEDAHQQLKAEAGEYLESRKALGEDWTLAFGRDCASCVAWRLFSTGREAVLQPQGLDEKMAHAEQLRDFHGVDFEVAVDHIDGTLGALPRKADALEAWVKGRRAGFWVFPAETANRIVDYGIKW